MKIALLLSLIAGFAFTISSPFCATASFVAKPSAIPTAGNSKYLKLDDYIKLSPDDLGALKGTTLNIWDKIYFKIMKINMRKQLKKNPDLLVAEYYSKKMNKRLAWGWWVLISFGILLVLFIIFTIGAIAALNGTG